ncbi:UNVERIFIED_CONTAM: hypothetical protein FKN15_047304 [Acipenser sinensis]
MLPSLSHSRMTTVFTGQHAGNKNFRLVAVIESCLCALSQTEGQCQDPWRPYDNKCYYISSDVKSWPDARSDCEMRGGDLMSISSVQERIGVSNIYWIGLNDVASEGVWEWSDGSPFLEELQNWRPGQPDNWQDNEDCVQFAASDSARWNDEFCTVARNYICKRLTPICPPGWIGFDSHCYWFVSNPNLLTTWSEAQGECSRLGGNLLIINSQAEQYFINGFLPDLLQSEVPDIWIGLSDQDADGTFRWVDRKDITYQNWAVSHPHNILHLWDCGQIYTAKISTVPTGVALWMGGHDSVSEGGWQWTDNSPFRYINWYTGNPDDYYGEDCTTVRIRDGYWNDDNCEFHRGYICKRRANSWIQVNLGEVKKVTGVVLQGCPTDDHWVKSYKVQISADGSTWTNYQDTNGRWNDVSCSELNTYICKHSKDHYPAPSISPTVYGCQEGWEGYRYSCYWLEETPLTWSAAKTFCQSKSSTLLHILDIWLDFSPVTFVNWAPGEPNDANGEEQCVQMSRHAGTWYDMNCGKTSAGYVCKKYPGDSHTAPPPTQPWSGHCPQDWLLFGNKCFLFKGRHDGKDEFHANWTFAQTWCGDQGGDLAVIDNQYENDFVASYLEDIRAPVWIGLSDVLHEGKFTWSDGSQVLYTNWNAGEPNNFGDSGKNCYKLVAEPELQASWQDAQAACEKEKGSLASIDHSYEQNFVAGVVLQGRVDAWIGLRRQGDGSYTWVDGWPVFYTHWGPGEPTNHNEEGCVTMHSPPLFHGTWNDTSCSQKQAYICKITSEKPPPTPAPGDGMCRQGWHTYGRYCYLVVSEKKGFSWPDSRHYCQMGSAELASIHSRAEVEFLVKLNYTRYHNLWIGLTKDSSYGWAWTDKSSFGFVNWAPGEPNEIFHPGGGAEKCVEMYVQDGKWNDNNCLEKRGFICRHRQCKKPCSVPRNTHFLRHKDTRSWELLVVGYCSGGVQSFLLCLLG